MSWEKGLQYRRFISLQNNSQSSSFGINKHCFIRKEHECGKLFGASKSCFIACPTHENLEPVLALISEKLTRVGIEPIIAVKERAYGQDIFCTKICGKIIESRFCIVILDDLIDGGNNFPNPNVYYEYGLMTSLRKHIIPLQKEGQKLAFNIQSYDTIKYNNANMSSEIERALRDAVRITDEKNVPVDTGGISEKSMLRRIELAGLKEISDEDNEALNEAITDTQFKAFCKSRENNCILLGKIDNDEDFLTCVEDVNIIIFRIEKIILDAINSIKPIRKRIEGIKDQLSHGTTPLRTIDDRERAREIDMLERRLALSSKIEQQYSEVAFGLIVDKDLDLAKITTKIKELIGENKRYHCDFSVNGELVIGETAIDLRPHA